jgi:hypothetical protein
VNGTCASSEKKDAGFGMGITILIVSVDAYCVSESMSSVVSGERVEVRG